MGHMEPVRAQLISLSAVVVTKPCFEEAFYSHSSAPFFHS